MARGRLGTGDVVPSGVPRVYAQKLFFVALAAVAPQAVSKLRTDVLPVYLAAFGDSAPGAVRTSDDPKEAQTDAVIGWSACRGIVQEAASALKSGDLDRGLRRTYREGREAVGKAVATWATEWHLPDYWVYETAMALLMVWATRPDFVVPETPDLLDPLDDQAVAEELGFWMPPANDGAEPFMFVHEGWRPEYDTRKDIAARMRERFERKLQDYLDTVEKPYVLSDEFNRTPEYRSLLTHLGWLVRYQVLREPWPAIAATADRELRDGRRVPVSTDFVARRAKQVAQLVDLTIEPVRRAGRPAGSTTKRTTNNRVTRGPGRR